MAKITGQITDFGFSPQTARNLRLYFRHVTPGVSGAKIMPTREVSAVVLYNGYFEADLIPTPAIAPAGYYVVTLEWTEYPNRVQREVFPGRLYVPAAGGVLSDLLRVPQNPALVWTGEEPPKDPSPGSWWQKLNGDIYEWAGDGWNFKNNIRGPAGYNATGAAGDQNTIAAYMLGTAGANPVSQALDKRMAATTYNVKLFGVRGDGTTDDTAALRALIANLPAPANAFGAVAPTLYFPAGRYIIDGALAFAQRISLQGDGPYQTILYRKNAAQGDFITLNGSTSQIRDLFIDGNRGNGTAGDGLVFNAAYCAALNVTMGNNPENGITIGKAGKAIAYRLQAVQIRTSSAYGIRVIAGSESTDGQMVNIGVGQSGLSGVRIDNGAQNLVNVHSWGNGVNTEDGVLADGAGFYLYSGNTVLTNCQAETNRFGFTVHGDRSVRNTFANCLAWGNRENGLLIYLAPRGILSGCKIFNNGTDNTTGSADPKYANIRNRAGQFWNFGTVLFDDDAGRIAPGAYSGFVPASPFKGRLNGVRSVSQHYVEQAEPITPFTPDFNTMTGSTMTADTTTTGIPVTTVGTRSRWSGNLMPGQPAQTLVANGSKRYPKPYSDVIKVTGTGTLPSIEPTTADHRITLVFTDPNPGWVLNAGNIKLRAEFKPVQNQTLSLVCDGVDWYETGRG